MSDFEAFLRQVPKAELHCHVEGTVRPETVVEQARKHGVPLPRARPARSTTTTVRGLRARRPRAAPDRRDGRARTVRRDRSDDPPMFGTDIGAEYVRMCTAAGWDAETVRELCLNGVDAAWLDDERRDLRRTFERELANLELAHQPRPRRTCERSP